MLADEGRYVHFGGDHNWWMASGQVFYSPNVTDSPAEERGFALQHYFLPHRYQDPFGKNTTVAYDDKHSLLVKETRDPVDNVVTVVTKDEQGNEIVALDYRVLNAWLVTDPNGNRSAVSFDALGLVLRTVVMGKLLEPDGNPKGDVMGTNFENDVTGAQIAAFFSDPKTTAATLLGSATTCFVYDVGRFYRGDHNPLNPIYAATISREMHVNDLQRSQTSRIQIIFSYSDGFGREIQTKTQAAPVEVAAGISPSPRWIGSGWAILNNKAKPVKKFEPFYSNNHRFEFAKALGVSSTLFYDPLGRVVATLHPNYTYEKVIYDSWSQKTWDSNDTVMQTDPKNDADVGVFFGRLSNTEYLPIWYERRKYGQLGVHEQEAASKTSRHADTPTIVFFDVLGRSFLTVADNGTKGKYSSHIELDIKGNEHAVIDALGRIVHEV